MIHNTQDIRDRNDNKERISAFNQNEIEPTCLLCKTDIENTEHFLLCCPALHSARQSILDIINGLYSSLHDPQLANHPRDLLQIVLDCSALYLTTPKRNHHIIETIEFHSRRLCYTLHCERYKRLALVPQRIRKKRLVTRGMEVIQDTT